MALYNRYRPTTFNEVVGNKATVSALIGLCQTVKDAPHAVLIHGPTGCGKTTLGRIFLKQLGAKGFDFLEMDSAHFRGIDSIRELRRKSGYKPVEGRIRGVLLDECHQLSKDAQHALLKELEDPPVHVYYVLCTTEPKKLLKTIRGRCNQHVVQTLSSSLLVRLLYRIGSREGEKLPRKILAQIAENSGGHVRNAIQTLEQVLSVGPDQREEFAKRAAEEQAEVIELCRILLRQKPSWKSTAKTLKGLKKAGTDAEGVRRVVLGYCQSVLLNSGQSRAASVMEEFLEPFYDTLFPGLVFACYMAVHKGE